MAYRLGPRVATAPLDLPAPPREADSGIGALGAGIAEAGKALQDISTRAFEVETRGQASGGLAKLQEALNGKLAEQRNLTADKAVAYGTTLPSVFEEINKDIRENVLQNDKSRELYDAKAAGLLASARGSVYDHVLHEGRVAQIANVDARGKQAQIAAAQDPLKAPQLAADLEDEIMSVAETKEAGQAAFAQKRADIMADAVTSLINQRDTDPSALDQAQVLFHSDPEAFGTHRSEIAETLAKTVVEGAALGKARDIISGAIDKSGRPNPDKIAEQLKTITNPYEYAAVHRQLVDQEDLANDSWNRQADDLKEKLIGQLETAQSSRAVDRRGLTQLRNLDERRANDVQKAMNRQDAYWRSQHQQEEEPTDAAYGNYVAWSNALTDRDPRVMNLSPQDALDLAQGAMGKKLGRKAAQEWAHTADKPIKGLSPLKITPEGKVYLDEYVRMAKHAYGEDPKTWVPGQIRAFTAGKAQVTEIVQRPNFRGNDADQFTGSWFHKGTVPGSGFIWDTKITRGMAETQGFDYAPTFTSDEIAEAKREAVREGLDPNAPDFEDDVKEGLRRRVMMERGVVPAAPAGVPDVEAIVGPPPESFVNVAPPPQVPETIDAALAKLDRKDPNYFTQRAVLEAGQQAVDAYNASQAKVLSARERVSSGTLPSSVRSRKQAVEALDAAGITDPAARERQLRDWGY